MAESKFLKYQDRNRDYLIDVCEVDLPPPEEQVCKDCVPNPKALVPNWKTFESLTPFLNEKTCRYEIAITTPETTTGANSDSTEQEAEEALQKFYEQYSEEVFESFLEFYSKGVTDSNKSVMSENVSYKDYYLDANPSSHLQLLYSFPFNILSSLDEEDEDDDEEDNAEAGDTTVEYLVPEMVTTLIRIRKGLNLYARYEKIFKFTDKATLLFLDTGGLFNLSNYGDAGVVAGSSITSNLMPQLDKFLIQKGFNIPGVGGLYGIFNDRVTKIEFTFSDEFKVKHLKVYTEGCGEKPTEFKESKLKRLNNSPGWKDPTAVAYFAQMKDMERDLTARVPKPWLEFVKEYTYPKVESVINAGYTNTDPENSAASCIAENLQREGKQLGQDLLDEVFGLGDAIASQFHKMLCNPDYKALLEQKMKLGNILVLPPEVQEALENGQDINSIDPQKFLPDSNQTDFKNNLFSVATEQAFREIDERDQVFANFCAVIGAGVTKDGSDLNLDLRQLWDKGLDKIRICGLSDLMIDAIQCLLGGLSLEEALSKMISSALTAMSIENFGSLFKGLPLEKQNELDALVKKKLAEGDIFSAGSQAQKISDEIAKDQDQRTEPSEDTDLLVLPEIVYPWEDLETVQEQEQTANADNYGGLTSSEVPEKESSDSDVTKATTKAQLKNAGSDLNKNLVMQAYISALIEVYSEDLLDLVDLLNRFPGAPVIAKVISMLDCPIPPIFDPTVADFLKDVELPFCRNPYAITLPRIQNPFSYLPKLKDLFRLLFAAIRIQLQKVIVSVIIKLIVKVCELIGNALCKALETAGSIAASLPSVVAGKTTFKDVIRETICGDEVPEEQIDDTIADMFQKLSSGGAAFADREAVISFAEDMSASTTRKEISDAVIGEPSETFISVIQSLVQFEYPQFGDAFNSREAIASFFKNIGNLMPLDARQAVKDFARGLDEDDQLPANPSLCATPQQIEDFCSLRSGLLEGRASPEQIAALCDNARSSFADDLEDLASILNTGIPNYIQSNMPPMVSDPGCNNGLVPFEPEEIAQSTVNALDANLESLKLSYTYDMIGNGPGQTNWGFINMVLSDTMGNPYTTHTRKSFNSGGPFTARRYVDFYVESADENSNYALVSKQQGAYPVYVADWLKDTQMPIQLGNASFMSSNGYQEDIASYRTFKQLNFDGLFGDVNLLTLPETRYNVETSVDFEEERVKFNVKARKSIPDMSLSYRDNAKGTGGYAYGFELGLYLSDIIGSNGVYVNRQDDNARMVISYAVNTQAETFDKNKSFSNENEGRSSNTKTSNLKWLEYEFLAIDDGLENLDTTLYPRYTETTTQLKAFIPQVYMLQDILEKAGNTPPEASVIKTNHDQIMETLFKAFAEEVWSNEAAFRYGAEFDDLTYEDVAYGVVNDDGEWQEYSEYVSDNEITNEDAILGVSYDQFLNEQNGTPENTRVYYLDPAQYGGNYFNPPVYVKPLKNSGWLGFVNAMFPEISPCKPYRADVVDFQSIQERIQQSYSSIPEDDRLKSEPDCVREEPYNRILERPSKAGIEGLISAAIRIYASVHLLKASATFTKFKPDFSNVHSKLYPQYIIEVMEKEFKDAQAKGEFLNPFKDEEFWYAFLEQSVQTYARRYADGQLEDPPAHVVDALTRIEQVILNHRTIYKNSYVTEDGRAILGLKEAKDIGDASLLQTLKGYRADKNLEVIKETEQDAKIIFSQLVVEELEVMSEIYIKNMKDVGMAGDDLVSDIRKYVLENLTEGSTLTIDKEIVEEVEGISATETDNLYTSGGMLITDEGEDYIGYYHIEEDDEGDLVYMSGAYPRDDGETLRVSAEKIIVPIGNIVDLGEATPSADKPFSIEKYIKIDGTYKTPDAAIATIKSSGTADTNISDVYPGTMELVYNEDGKEIGIQGELGVRYGLRFSIDAGAGKQTLVEVEVDALDLPVTEVQPLQGDSKLLLCLVNNLLDDPDFNAVMKYIFPLNKLLSTIAVYNDIGFVSSIGETVVEDAFGTGDIASKPGRYIVGTGDTLTVEDGATGWFSGDDRSTIFGNGFFVLHFDKWDQKTLSKSKAKIKKLFKEFYNSRDFNPNGDDSESPSKLFIAQMIEAFRPSSGQNLLPWWKKRMLRTNPFNADGALCDKKE